MHYTIEEVCTMLFLSSSEQYVITVEGVTPVLSNILQG